ncbi:MAG: D-alanyl-D-alanine carboxypeptidase [Raoultibacter sp.]
MRLIDSSKIHRSLASCAGLFLACVLAIGMSSTLCIPSAAADVRKADVILGETVDARGLSISTCPSIDAEYALVMDAEGTVYFERSGSHPTQIASITKVMTAIVALDSTALDTPLTVSATAASVGESSAQLIEGDTLTLSDALKALLVSSGNDAAEAIAETLGAAFLAESGTTDATAAQSVQAFVDHMNQKAKELGMQDSVFANPHGLDDGAYAGDQHSCAADVALMVKYAMKNQAFRDCVGQPNVTIAVTRAGAQVALDLKTTDELLGAFEGACGVKTGFTDLAGPSFAAASNRGEGDLYAVVIHSSSEAQRFVDAQTLLQWVYDHNVMYPLVHSPETVDSTIDGAAANVPLLARVAHTEWIDVTVPATIADPTAAVTVFDINGNVSQSVEYHKLTGNVQAGDKVGTISFKQRNVVLATADLIACEDRAAPNLIEGVGIWWDRLFRGFSDKETVAESVLVNQTPLIVDKSAPSGTR